MRMHAPVAASGVPTGIPAFFCDAQMGPGIISSHERLLGQDQPPPSLVCRMIGDCP